MVRDMGTRGLHNIGTKGMVREEKARGVWDICA